MNDVNFQQGRLEKLRRKIEEKRMDAIMITKRENCAYLSGFLGTFAYLLITPDSANLITDFRYAEQARMQSPIFNIVQCRDNAYNTVRELVESIGIKRLGFEEHHVTYEEYGEFEQKLGAKELIPVKRAVESLRIIKDRREIELMATAAEIADKAFTHILDYIRPGISEVEIASELESFMRKNGASGASFETIVASGIRGSLPHGVASGKQLEPGDAITLDFGAVYKGYCSDMTRTVFLGEPCEELKEIYRVVLKAQICSLEAACRGKTGKQVDSIARDIITEAGYGDSFGHGLGHGVGLEIHEDPKLSPNGSLTLEKGMAVTVEPGIYISSLGGIRIEDLIVIDDERPLVLTKSPKEMIVL